MENPYSVVKRTKGFQKGHQLSKGHGRPPKVVEQAYLEAFREELPPDEFREAVVRPAVEKAKQGDTRAARILMEQAMGKPAQRIIIEKPADENLGRLQAMLAQNGFFVEHQMESSDAEPTALPPSDGDGDIIDLLPDPSEAAISDEDF
jgi:hypothetical protein